MKIKLPVLSHEWDDWRGYDADDGAQVTLCHDAMKELFKLKRKNRYQLTIHTKRPKKWTRSGTFVVEPCPDGHQVFLQKRGTFYQLPTETADWVLNNVYFKGTLRRKVWIRVKKVKNDTLV